MKFLLDIIQDSVNCHLYNAQSYMNVKQNSMQLIHSFNIYLAELKAQLASYTEAQLVTHFFTKLQLKLCKALTNYQNLSTT